MIDQLDACKWLFLREITEPHDNAFRLVIEEARSSDTPEDVKLLDIAVQGLRRIEHDESCRVFEVSWEGYISYSVTNESYAKADDPESYVGKRVRRYSRSAFLDYVGRATFASSDYPGPFHHIGIVCENHIIDVVSTVEPQVLLVKPGRPRIVKHAQQGAPGDAPKSG